MRNKLPMMVLGLALGTGVVWAAPPTIDTQAMEGIQSRLNHARVNQHGDVQVTVDRGVATLTGTVDNLGAKLDAEKAAQKTQGVTQVVNNIRVRAQGVEDREILKQAQHEINMYYAYGMFDHVTFAVDNGALTVNGEVTQPFKKTDVRRILERVKGVTALENNIEVLPNSPFDDRLRAQVARAIYGSPFFTPYANLALPPIRIIVKNGNVTLEGVVVNQMDRVQAGMAANLAGLAFSVVNNLHVVKG
jgi:hyperosmotically inducible protein